MNAAANPQPDPDGLVGRSAMLKYCVGLVTTAGLALLWAIFGEASHVYIAWVLLTLCVFLAITTLVFLYYRDGANINLALRVGASLVGFGALFGAGLAYGAIILDEHDEAPPFPPACAETDCNCGDFATHAEAQLFFCWAGPGDPHGLDTDGDGIACEELP
jgi:hypothetical protein